MHAITKFTRNRHNQERAPSSGASNLGFQVQRQNCLMQPIQSLFWPEGSWVPGTLPKMASWRPPGLHGLWCHAHLSFPSKPHPRSVPGVRTPGRSWGKSLLLSGTQFFHLWKRDGGAKLDERKMTIKITSQLESFPTKVLTKYTQSPFLLGHCKVS